MFCENRTVVIFLFVARRINREAFCGMFHLFVAYLVRCYLFQGVYPVVTYTVGELFFLSPCNLFGQHIRKCLTHDFLFYRVAGTHLGFRVGAHRNIQKLFVKEWHTTFHALCGKTLVSTQTVVHIQFRQFTNGLFMEGLRIRCFMEIQISAEYLMGTFTAQCHFYAHALDDTGKEVHWCRRSYSSHVISFYKIDDITYRVNAFLYSIVDLMMHGSDMVGHHTRLGEVGSTFQSYGE